MLAKVKESRPSWIPTAEIHQFESNILDGYESLPIEQAEIYWPRYSRSTLMADLRHPAGPYWSIPIREMLAPDLQGATVQLDRLFDVGPTGPAYQARIVTSKGLEYSVTGMMRGIYPNTDFQDGFGALISLGNILVVPHESREAALWACLDMLRDAPLGTESAELVFSETADPRRLVISARLREQHPVLGSEISLEYQDGWLLSIERRF
jgi:hypothetical protein